MIVAATSAADMSEIVLAVIAFIGAMAAGLKWMVKHYLWELKPNHGTSMSDRLQGVENRVERMEGQVDLIYKHLIGE